MLVPEFIVVKAVPEFRAARPARSMMKQMAKEDGVE